MVGITKGSAGEGSEKTDLLEVVIPDGVTIIEQDALLRYTKLRRLILPASLNQIAQQALSLCATLDEITVAKENVTFKEIDGVLYDVMAKTVIWCSPSKSGEVSILPGTEAISISAFSGCEKIRTVRLPNSLAAIEQWAFCGCTGLLTVILPPSVRSIGTEAFYRCSSLRSIILPPSLLKLAGGVFYGCSSLTNISLPEGITELHNGLFYQCTALISVDLPKNLSAIGDWAFYGCILLKNIAFPDRLAHIGNSAFRECASLTSVSIPKGVAKVQGGAFLGCICLKFIFQKVLSTSGMRLSSAVKSWPMYHCPQQ